MGYKSDFDLIDKDKYYFDSVAADGVVRYVEENIRHVSGPLSGQLLVLEDWQKDEVIRPLFGWKHTSNGMRKYTTLYCEIPKKNGKSFLCAALAAIFLDIEPEKGEVPIYSIAGNNDQARLVFNATKGIIAQSKRLGEKAELLAHSIIVKKGNDLKFFRAMASKSETQQGVNPQLVIADEVHIHKDADLIENQRKSMIARSQPLFAMITTAGSDLYGVGYAEHTHAKEVVMGLRTDETILVTIHCADKGDDPYSEKTWKKANPNYGVSVTKRGLKQEADKAKYSKASENSFLRYHLNIWTQSKDAWIQDFVWQQSKWDIDFDLTPYECKAGLDLSGTSDITAFGLVWLIDDKYYSKLWYFLPEDKGSNSADKENQQYAQWVKDGLIIETRGNTIDYDYIVMFIEEKLKEYNVSELAFDPYMATHVIPRIDAPHVHFESFGQDWKAMTNPTSQLEKQILDKNFNHFGDPVLRWMAGNALLDTGRDGKIAKLVKDKSSPQKKIDGLIVCVMALGLWLHNDEKGSYLEEGNLYII
jgi:phage terminase large subunit-like protein